MNLDRTIQGWVKNLPALPVAPYFITFWERGKFKNKNIYKSTHEWEKHFNSVKSIHPIRYPMRVEDSRGQVLAFNGDIPENSEPPEGYEPARYY